MKKKDLILLVENKEKELNEIKKNIVKYDHINDFISKINEIKTYIENMIDDISNKSEIEYCIKKINNEEIIHFKFLNKNNKIEEINIKLNHLNNSNPINLETGKIPCGIAHDGEKEYFMYSDKYMIVDRYTWYIMIIFDVMSILCHLLFSFYFFY